uniref:Uncharacterized protein n=1 Tax=Rhizophora mucronata TaxID=61149 RepID=A0A2P2MXQ4_RHIMU
MFINVKKLYCVKSFLLLNYQFLNVLSPFLIEASVLREIWMHLCIHIPIVHMLHILAYCAFSCGLKMSVMVC